MFGMVNRDKFKLGATWFGQPVRIVETGPYRGSLYLFNAPDGSWPRGELPGDWKHVVLPPPPSGNSIFMHPNNPYPPVVDWNVFDWPDDARYQWGVKAGAYVSHYVNQSFYEAPPGALFHPVYAHLGR